MWPTPLTTQHEAKPPLKKISLHQLGSHKKTMTMTEQFSGEKLTPPNFRIMSEIRQVCRSSLLSGRNVRWPGGMLFPGESRWVCRRDRHTDGRTPDRYITLYAMDAASVKTASSSAVADEPARRAAPRQTAKMLQQSRDHNHTHLGGDMSFFLVILDIAYMCKKFDDSSMASGMFMALKFKVDHVTWSRPFQGQFVVCRLGHTDRRTHDDG